MHKSLRLLALLGAVLVGANASAHESGEPLTAPQKQFLAHYEHVRAALAADDLAAAQKAAATIPENENAADLAQAATLAEARGAFQKLSRRAVHLAANQPGYFVAQCPMVKTGKGDWVQTNSEISNPYFGHAMLTCGTIISGEKAAPDHGKSH